VRSTIQTRAFAHPEHNKKIIYLYVQTTPTREKKDKKEKKEEKKQPTGPQACRGTHKRLF
jgi:hypothetical protein